MTPLPPWIADPALTDTWTRIRDRFERSGLRAHGRIGVTAETRQQRHALGALLGLSVTSSTIRIDLNDLDQRLRERSGVGGLHDVLAVLHGDPPIDRLAAKGRREAERQQPLTLAAQLVQAPWSAEWIEALRRTGTLTGREDASKVVTDAAVVLTDLTATNGRPQSRVELGARLLGDAHALDPDRVLHRVVLRGLAAAAGTVSPVSRAAADELWTRYGVEPDLLSRTCLVWALRPQGESGARLRLAADAGDPTHITEWDLRRTESFGEMAGAKVLVCENPRVVEATAEAHIEGWALVCTSGEPNLVVTGVLGRLQESGATLYYHGDFDWPGIAIANRLITRFAVTPWHMSADDYLEAVRSDAPRLQDAVVTPDWDTELGAAMRRHQRALHEESVLPQLLGHLQQN